MPTAFAHKFKALRVEHKLTQSAMGQLLHTDTSRICRLERGKHPSTRILEQINKVFGVNAYAWMEEEENEVPGPRVVHLDRSIGNVAADDESFRTKAVDLIGRMMDMLESLTRISRGGGGGMVCDQDHYAGSCRC